MKSEKKTKNGSIFSAIVIPAAIIVGVCLYIFVFGDPSHFQGGSHANQPLPGDYFGVVYKGGFVVPMIFALLIIAVTFTIERSFALSKAKGKSAVVAFVGNVRSLIAAGRIDDAIVACDKQKGSVGNVIKSALLKYKTVETDNSLTKDQQILSIQKEIEEATSLELPSLEQNLPVLATLSQIGTLFGLLGTVLGMIRAFSALANAGAPDSVALSAGISEALINTALGITTAAIAIITYSFFTTQIDKLTYSIDEAGFSIVQTYASKH